MKARTHQAAFDPSRPQVLVVPHALVDEPRQDADHKVLHLGVQLHRHDHLCGCVCGGGGGGGFGGKKTKKKGK